MSFKVIPKRSIKTWMDQLRGKGYRIVGPKAQHGQYIFDELSATDEIVLDYPSTVLPPKKFLLPQREELFHFNTKTMEMKEVIEAPKTVILGMHTCDMHAVELLDTIHSTGYVDQHYQARRENTVLISVECLTPCTPGSFCKSMGTLSVPEHFDLHLTDLGNETYAVDIGSDKGAALLEGFASVWEHTDEDYEQINHVLSEKWAKFQYRLEFDITELPDLLATSMKSPVWNELGERCLACGMCTKVCPTCYCFDVTDEVDLTLENGTRVRTWDSCQIDKFAVVAGGHNFRTSRALRQRHRFMRKGKYQFEAYGLLGCVGCGRCATACLVDITPVDTFNALHRERINAMNAAPSTGGD